MNREYDEQNKSSAEGSENEQDYAYKNVIKDKQHRRTWSVVSLALAILSVLLTRFSLVGIILALASGGAAAMSRRNLGYFDRISLAAIFVAIFGLMFAVTGLIFEDLIFSFLA